MRRLLLTRHGETAWNAIGRLQGHTDIVLNETGRAQARAIAHSLARGDVTEVWTSDLSRARETGAIIAELLGLPPPQIDPELRERAYGVFEGLTRDECQTRHPEAWQAWQVARRAPPGGEPPELATARIHRALERLALTAGGPALVVSHGGVMRLWLMELLAEAVPPIENGSTYVVEHDGARFSARRRVSDG